MESSPTSASAFVVAVIASFRRAPELTRLLAGLSVSSGAPAAVVVIDNGDDTPTRQAVESFGSRGHCLTPGTNLGCGGGLRQGIKFALAKFGEHLTHIWILDDDAVVEADTLSRLLDRSLAAGVEVASPMVVDAFGRIGWFPGLLRSTPWKAIRQARTPAEYVERCGPGPVPFSWSPGVSLLVTARALKVAGLPRGDFWVRGEDLEFALRLTADFASAFLPDVVVRHLQPAGLGATDKLTERLKVLAMLQNLAYMSFHLPHGRRMLRTLPGNSFRFLRSHGWTASNVSLLARALWVGAVRGYPAGDPRGNELQRAAEQ